MQKSTLFLIGLCFILIGGGLTYRYFVRDTDSRGATKLMRAIEDNESLKDTSKLISKTEDINIADKKGKTALLYAARYSREGALIRNLIQAGADVNRVDNNGRTAILVAAYENPSPEVMEALIENGADVNGTDSENQSPLVLAAQNNIGPVIEVLLRANTDLNVIDKNGTKLVDILAHNMHLSDLEKNNYRQLFLILSILEARDKARLSGFLPTDQNNIQWNPIPSQDVSEFPPEALLPHCCSNGSCDCAENEETETENVYYADDTEIEQPVQEDTPEIEK